jgi:capsid protein
MHTLRRDDDLTEKFRDEYQAIWSALVASEPDVEGEGKIRATIRNMSHDDASRVADRIFHLYVHVLHGSAL